MTISSAEHGSVKERLELVHACGVQQVILRFVNSAGNLCEHCIEITDLPASMFEKGITLEDRPTNTSERTMVTVYPDKHSAWMNPFQDKPSLALLCYLQPVDSNSGEGQVVTSMLSSAFMNPFLSPSTGNSAPHMMLASPASIYETPKGMSSAMGTPMGMGPSMGTPIMRSTQQQHFQQQPPQSMTAFSPRKHSIMMTPTAESTPSPMTSSSRIETIADQSDASISSRKHTGTSCHQCKNARPPEKLAYCNRLFDKRSGSDKRLCRKKYCAICLHKFYNDSVDLAKMKPDWVCPSCKGLCQCAACQRKIVRKKMRMEQRSGAAMRAGALMDLAEQSLQSPGNI